MRATARRSEGREVRGEVAVRMSSGVACWLKLLLALLLPALCLLLSGCDPVTRHKALSTIFDGVPTLPPAENLCKDYYTQRVAAERSGATVTGEGGNVTTVIASVHLPYEEKRCSDCHTEDKDKNDGLVRQKRELCFVCHKDFIKGSFVHGPVAVGECQACHLPHNSTFTGLLKTEKGKLCESCHREKRLTTGMHERFVARQMVCIDCHDPHFGEVRYFLK